MSDIYSICVSPESVTILTEYIYVSKKMTNEKIEYEIGSGDVFKDLEILNPEEYLAKARLAGIIYDIIAERKLKHGKAAKQLDMSNPSCY